jgi:hypothetical protein
MIDLNTYENILVSGVKYDFSQNWHENIPHRLYAEWAALVVKLAEAVHPAFDAPPFPASLNFQTEAIPSDLPYPADENYYMLDYISFRLASENGYGLKIDFENGRQGGDNPVNIETIGFNYSVSSHISKEAKSPLATIFVWHDAGKTPEIKEIIARHREYCLASAARETERQ